MTYKDTTLMVCECTIKGAFILSLLWPYLLAYKLGKITDKAPASKIDIGAAALCGLGTFIPVIPMSALVSNTPVEEAYRGTYNFFSCEENKVSSPSANGLLMCYLFTVIPVLPTLALASVLTIVPSTFLVMLLFEVVAFPCTAFFDYIYPEVDALEHNYYFGNRV